MQFPLISSKNVIHLLLRMTSSHTDINLLCYSAKPLKALVERLYLCKVLNGCTYYVILYLHVYHIYTTYICICTIALTPPREEAYPANDRWQEQGTGYRWCACSAECLCVSEGLRYPPTSDAVHQSGLVSVCVCACARVCVCVCVCEACNTFIDRSCSLHSLFECTCRDETVSVWPYSVIG